MVARFRPSPAMVVACVALVIALGGSAYAVTAIPANSVGTRQLKSDAVTTKKLHKGAVTSRKVKDGTLTANDVKPNTFLAANGDAADSLKLGGLDKNQFVQGLGFAPVRRLVVPSGGSGLTVFATGFGTFTAACSSNVPVLSYIPDRNGENFEATVTSDGGTPITKIDTQNAIASGAAHPIDNSAGGRQSISFQVGFTDSQDHVASGMITSQFLFGTGCLFMAQGLTSG